MNNSTTDDILALFNGTPILSSETVDNQIISTPDVWQNIGLKDEVVQTIPIVILDDGQIALHCNGQYFLMSGIQTEEIITPNLTNPPVQLNSCNSVSPSFRNTVSVPENNIVTPASNSIEEPVGDSSSLSDEVDVVNVDCDDSKAVSNDVNTNSNEWIPVECLKDFFPTVQSFRCLSCNYITQNQEEISSHLHAEFVIVSQLQTNENGSTLPGFKAPLKNINVTDELVKNGKDVQEKFVYLCSQCSDVFASLEQCRDHMIKDHNMILSEESFVEDLQQSSLPLKPIDTNSANSEKSNNCNENASNQATDTNSIKSSAENIEQKIKNNGKNKIKSLKVDPDYDVRLFKCKHVSCVQKFRSNEALAQHTACHRGPNRREYACSQCGSKFDEWRHCSLHLWNAHNIDVDLLTCGVCGMHKTTSRVNLETHMKIHRDVREYACPVCGKRFKQKAQMRNHSITHMNKQDISGTTQPPRWYMTQKCHICFKTYADSKCLKKHIQAVHSKLKPYVCHVCGHSSARKAMLQAHLRQHTGEKPYACQSCNFRTGDHNSLRRHMMRHSGERPYKCPHCPYASIQSTSFKNHLQIRHPGKGGAFGCVRCTFTTVSHSSFVQHLSDHKNNLIPSDQTDDVEVFPENVAAAQLVYQCLGACAGDGSRFQADVTASSTSDDGTKQTITIEIPTNSEVPTTDDEDTANCFLQSDAVDTGGITIPAEPPEPILVDYT